VLAAFERAQIRGGFSPEGFDRNLVDAWNGRQIHAQGARDQLSGVIGRLLSPAGQ
jgi:hypothetical protein